MWVHYKELYEYKQIISLAMPGDDMPFQPM